MAVSIITDSTSYLPLDERERYGIDVVPLSVTLDGVEFVEDTPAVAGFYGGSRRPRASRRRHNRR